MLKWKRLHVFLTVGVLCLICFLPLCGAIMRSMDAKRFGVFDYESFADVQDFRVERYLPPAATHITVDKYAQGFRARFTISRSDLDSFLDELSTNATLELPPIPPKPAFVSRDHLRKRLLPLYFVPIAAFTCRQDRPSNCFIARIGRSWTSTNLVSVSMLG